MRIVSLLPAATEMICCLGLEEQLVGVTHECDFPESVRRLPHVTRTRLPADLPSEQIDRMVRDQLTSSGSLYSLDTSLLRSLRPDLIVTQTLCSVCAVSEIDVRDAVCSMPGSAEILNLQPQTLSELFDALKQLAQITGTESAADRAIRQLSERVRRVAERTAAIEERPRTLLLEWVHPPFSGGHWNPELVRLAGGTEGFSRDGQPSRRLAWSEIVAWRPEVVVVACCGFDVKRTRQDLPRLQSVSGWPDLPAVRNGRVCVVDGSCYFSRPGPRLVDSLEILAHAVHPDRHPLPSGLPGPWPVDQRNIWTGGSGLSV